MTPILYLTGPGGPTRHILKIKQLDEESSYMYLTTFNTPFGRYRFLRMPFGLRMSQDVFQQKIDETYRNCAGTVGIADDIQVYGTSEHDHDIHLHEAMERTRKSGIKLNADKCVVKTTQCKCFGLLYTPEGVKPNPDKVKALTGMHPPGTKKELRIFLGLVNYIGPFIPNLADQTVSLRKRLQNDVEYNWSPSHTQVFNTTKALIAAETILALLWPKATSSWRIDQRTWRHTRAKWPSNRFRIQSPHSSWNKIREHRKRTTCTRSNVWMWEISYIPLW